MLYLKSRHNTEASIALSKKVDKAAEAAGVPLIIDDPRESSVQSLAWYGEQIYNSAAVICHLISSAREGALLHNAKYSLVAGLAHGMGKPLLMLAHGDFTAPIDYRDLLKHYQTATEAERHFDAWIVPILTSFKQRGLSEKAFIAAVEMARQLTSLRIGEPIAENEANSLRDEYFVETYSYREALEGRQTIFVGRKGSGKSASFIKLAAALDADKRNLVCIIKPIAYEFQGIVKLLNKYRDADIKGYAIESLWKFLIYSEIANAAAATIRGRLSQTVDSDEMTLLSLLEQNRGLLESDFSVRLERCIEALLQSASSSDEGTEARRLGISEALHAGFLRHLRDALLATLAKKQRVAVLVDNLDKAWDKQSDVEQLSEFLLGLLKASTRISNDFRNVGPNQRTVNVSLAVFIRADIFHKVIAIAREPDKIPFSKILWSDKELLLRLVEERFVASLHDSSDPRAIWDKFFDARVRGIETKQYFLSRILHRPRDLLVFVKAAITTAVNRKHARVSADDVLSAERQYSQFALDSILVENGISFSELENVLYEFAGCKAILTQDEIMAVLHRAKVTPEKQSKLIQHLCNLTFLGIETHPSDFQFGEDEQETRKNEVLARKLSERTGLPPRFRISPAFCAFLEVAED